MTNEPVSVAIADDHPVVRQGLRFQLEKNSRFKIVQEFSNAASLMKEFSRSEWEVLILDVDLKDGNGVELTKQMLLHRPELKILILSIYPEHKYAARAMKAGAKGYINKDSLLDKIEEAVSTVASGKLYMSKEVSEILALESIKGLNKEYPHSELSDRELQILCLYGSGKTNHEIADQLYLSIKTVSTYRGRILKKMNFKTTAELMSYAIEHKLVV